MIMNLLSRGMGWFMPYRWIFGGTLFLGLAITIGVFYHNCKLNSLALSNSTETIINLELDLAVARQELAFRNKRISEINSVKRKELVDAKKALEESIITVRQLQKEREELSLDLQEVKFELLENIANDEELHDWVDYTVPSSAWSLLNSTAQDRDGATRVRTPD